MDSAFGVDHGYVAKAFNPAALAEEGGSVFPRLSARDGSRRVARASVRQPYKPAGGKGVTLSRPFGHSPEGQKTRYSIQQHLKRRPGVDLTPRGQ